MHTLVIQTKHFGEVRIHHSSDWSGNAIVSWQVNETTQKSVELPAEIFAIIGRMKRNVPTSKTSF